MIFSEIFKWQNARTAIPYMFVSLRSHLPGPLENSLTLGLMFRQLPQQMLLDEITCVFPIFWLSLLEIFTTDNWLNMYSWGWSGGAKVLCILHHRGVQLILAYSWARPAILVVGKGRGGMFLFLLFLHFHSCSSFFPVRLFHLLYSLFYLFSPFLWETTQNDPQGLACR